MKPPAPLTRRQSQQRTGVDVFVDPLDIGVVVVGDVVLEVPDVRARPDQIEGPGGETVAQCVARVGAVATIVLYAQMTARDQMRKEAREEATLSGEFRRAVHASELTLSVIAAQAGITPLMLDDFLTGERTLRSDVIDRLADVLGCQLTRTG